jgi:hypothetical protein
LVIRRSAVREPVLQAALRDGPFRGVHADALPDFVEQVYYTEVRMSIQKAVKVSKNSRIVELSGTVARLA